MNIPIKMNKDFEKFMAVLQEKYGEDFEYLNGFHESQMNFSDFIDAFVDKNVADVTIDANANASSKDIRSLLNEKGKSIDKMFAFNKIFYEIKKKYGLKTAKEWLEAEYSGAFYMHDAPSSSMLPYCFSGDTRIMTKDGIRRLDELVDKDIMVLGKNRSWEPAVVQKFGVAPLRKITLNRCGTRKEIRATGNHRWFVKSTRGDTIVVTTDELQPKMKIPFNTSKTWSDIKPSPFGIAHGFYTGDGDKGSHARANFCGDKAALIPYFTPANVTGDEHEYAIGGIPNYFKKLPPLSESKQYLYGWLAGYFAADGSVDEHGRCTITSCVRP